MWVKEPGIEIAPNVFHTSKNIYPTEEYRIRPFMLVFRI